ncbi:MAG: FkbM family methyltransferase [Clostridia bacterium]|nr:FkbM family methyltransferase [Clostridia bacterium]
MQDLWNYLKTVSKPIFLYGTGNGADKILDELIRLNISVSGVFASDGFVRSRTFRGFPVQSYSAVKQQFGDIIVLVAFGSYLTDVIDNIKRIASENELYAPDVPVIPDGTIFNLEYARAHRAELEKVYNLLCDELSKKTFYNTVMYKLSGKLEYLFDCETDKSEIISKLGLHNTKNYIDLGAYNGDTVAEFLEYNANYEKIIAVEPDKKNFRKLSNNIGELNGVELINAAVGEKNGEVLFRMSGGRNSAVGDTGAEIRQVCVDDFGITKSLYIKFDVEGAEENAIRGAENTIKGVCPILNIAAYHKNSDIFSIPLLVKSINNDYNVVMRHHPYIPAWDTNFYFINREV